MKRDPLAYLWDVTTAADAVTAFVADKSFADYQTDLMLRSAVERQFEIIGEALNQLSKHFPELAQQIPDLREIVAFRNLLIHGYATINNAMVWRVIGESLPELHQSVVVLSDNLQKLNRDEL